MYSSICNGGVSYCLLLILSMVCLRQEGMFSMMGVFETDVVSEPDPFVVPFLGLPHDVIKIINEPKR